MKISRGFIVAFAAFVAITGVMMAVLTFKAAPVSGDVAAFVVEDAYLRSSTPSSKSAAAFLKLTNQTGKDDRLVGARSALDGRIELHTHTEDASGVMRMSEIEGGVPLAAGEAHLFKRGGDHLMFMGLTAPLEQGQDVPVTLIFETAGEVEIVIPVDQERKAGHGSMND